jgi:hypothetical protein
MTPSTYTAWAIKAPDGRLRHLWIASTRNGAILLFCDYAGRWKRWYRKGYRCVKVEFREVE